MQPWQPGLRIPLPGRASPSQNGERPQRGSPSLGLLPAQLHSFPDVSSLSLTPWISAPSAGCHLEGEAPQAQGKAVNPHLSQSFQYPPGLRRLQLLNWAVTPGSIRVK